MKNTIYLLLIMATSVFAQEKPKSCTEMFYVTMGGEIPTQKHYYYSKMQRKFTSMGIGTRNFFCLDHGVDTCVTFYTYPKEQMYEVSVAYLYMPKFFHGVYMGIGAYTRYRINIYLSACHHTSPRALVGYQFPIIQRKSNFFEVGCDVEKNITIRSGLLF